MKTPWYAAWLCGAMFIHAPARAEELSDASLRVFREAIAAADKKQWAECRTKVIGVWQQEKNANVAGLLGICEAELGMNRDAAEHLDYFFANQKDAVPAQMDQAKKAFESVRPKVAMVEVTPVPDDAFVESRGAPVGRGRQRLWVEPGDVVLGVAKDGESKSQTVQVAGGDTRTVTIQLPAGTGGAGGAGDGGSGVGGLGAGGSGAGGTGGEGGGGDSSPTWLGWVLGGSGLAAAGVGAALFGVAQGKLGDASSLGDMLVSSNSDCLAPQGDAVAQCAEAQTLVDDAVALRIGGGVLLGIGAAAIVGAIVVWTLPSDDAKASAIKMQLVPWVDGQSGGFVMRGVY